MFTFSKATRPTSPVNQVHNIYTTYQQRPASPVHYNTKIALSSSPRPISPAPIPNVFYKPAANPIAFVKPTSPHHRTIITPTYYNPVNLYYNAMSPHSRSVDSSGSRSYDHSYDHKRYIQKATPFYSYPPDSRSKYDGRRVMSPLPGNTYMNESSQKHHKGYKVKITYSSPPTSPTSGKKPELLNSKSSLFSFGEPKKPEILNKKKPGVRRMNSSGNSASEQQNYKIYVHYDNETKPKPNSNSFTNSKQISTIYERNFNSKPVQPIGKFAQTKQSKQHIPVEQNQILNYSISQQIVNTTPRKQEQESTGTVVAKFDDHTYEQQNRIASLLVGQLQLNYDYFRDVDKSDRSISDYVVL